MRQGKCDIGYWLQYMRQGREVRHRLCGSTELTTINGEREAGGEVGLGGWKEAQ